MNRTLARMLQAAVVVFAVAVLAFLLWEPHLEGRNAHATTFQVYFNDPFLAVAYLASIAFFVGCFQAFRALGDVASFGAPTARAARSLRIVRACALILLAFVSAGEVAIFLQGDNGDDRAGGVAMGVLIGLGCVVVAWVASALARRATQRLPT